MNLRPLFTKIDELRPYLDAGNVVLTPNQRLSRSVRQADATQRAQAGASSWSSSVIMPLRQYWIERWNAAVTRGALAPRMVIDAFQQRLLWEQVVEADPQGFSLLNSHRAAQLCQEAGERLALWRVDLQAPGTRQHFSFAEDSQAFLGWHEAVQDRIQSLDAITPEQAVAELLEHPEFADEELVLLHLHDTPPLYDALIALAPMVHQVDRDVTLANPQPAQIFDDERAELQAVARWCREQYERDPEGRYAVVLNDMEDDRDILETLLRQEFDCLTRNYDSLPVNFATGFTLDRMPIIRDALRVLRIAGSDVEVEDLIGVFHSPFIAPLSLAAESAEQQIGALRDLAVARIPQLVLRQVLEPLAGVSDRPAPWIEAAKLEERSRLHQRSRPPSQWIPVLRALLECWGWAAGRPLDTLEFQQLNQWDMALDGFAQLDNVVGSLSYYEALAQLREVLSQQQFQPRTSDRAVQVLGPLETTGLSFDALWITGMEGGRWPSSPRPNPYLPHSLQKAWDMPHVSAAWEWNWAQHRWNHWLGATPCLHTSYIGYRDGAAVLPSPLLPSDAEAEPGPAWNPSERWQQQSELSQAEVDPGAAPLTAQEPARRGVSSSVIEAQSLCPFRGFATARLRAHPQGSTSSGLLPSERGNMLHHALHRLFAAIEGREALRALDDGAREELIAEAIAEGIQAIDSNRRFCVGSAILDLEQTRMQGLLRAWLDIESGRSEDFLVMAREEAFEITLGGLRIRLRTDRRDRLGDGSEVILDYKSGSVESPGRWFQERTPNPQLPLYALGRESIGGVSYASLKTAEMGFSGIGIRAFADGVLAADRWEIDGETPEERLRNLRDFWTAELEIVAAEIVAGEAGVEPSKNACRYCGRQSLCRIGDVES